MTPDELRQKYLNFFTKQNHHVIPSAPLVPENDPTTLFTSAGMQPLMPYFLGQPHPKGSRIVDSQKCFRAVDIEEVGDNRHTTFFEMLGNWSFGDYFKKEQLSWVFTFLTDEIGLDPNNLFVTAYKGDETIGVPKDLETPKIWQELFASVGVEAKVVEAPEKEGLTGRIYYYGDSNWWSRAGAPKNMPAGEPGGPDSEIFFDFGERSGFHEKSKWKDQKCHPNCDCGRFLEIGNSVFMQYQKNADGTFSELPQRNVDFGGGLERILAAANGDPDVFKTESFQPIIKVLEQMSEQSYQDTDLNIQRSYRVIVDHVRAAVMLASDGVLPANKEQGYFSRRLLRRAIRYGKMIGLDRPFIGELVPVIADLYQRQYPNVKSQQDQIQAAFIQEETKFLQTLAKGLKEIEKLPELDGAIAFKLYETYGFPLELTQEIAEERGQVIDRDVFQQAFNAHKDKSRTASAGTFKGGLADQSEAVIKYHTATHLLHAALRKLLGNDVQQKGSNITNERLRFDFSFTRALTNEEKRQIEKQINEWITADFPVTKQVMNKQLALQSGAVAFFIEKYPDEVSVYTVGKNVDNDWISKEFCGGPHVTHTGEIGTIKLTKEQAVAAGIRRIYIELA